MNEEFSTLLTEYLLWRVKLERWQRLRGDKNGLGQQSGHVLSLSFQLGNELFAMEEFIRGGWKR